MSLEVPALHPLPVSLSGSLSPGSPASCSMRGAASCDAVFPLIDHATREGWSLDGEKIACPVRVVWGTDDRLLSWPSAAARYRDDWLPHADWIELEGIGHCPQLDVPLETAQLILGFTGVERECPVLG